MLIAVAPVAGSVILLLIWYANPARAAEIADVIGVVVAVLGLGASFISFSTARRRTQATPGSSILSDRIELLRENLSTSSSLIEEISAELQVQTTALDRIRTEAEENRRLAALHQDEADAVRQLVETTIQRAQGMSMVRNKQQQWLFFLAGLFLAVPLGVAGNFVYALVVN
jgi:hypothetical protein